MRTVWAPVATGPGASIPACYLGPAWGRNGPGTPSDILKQPLRVGGNPVWTWLSFPTRNRAALYTLPSLLTWGKQEYL